MIKQKITLVLGAGASFPYGFPLGRDLKNDIANELTNWSDVTIKEVHLVSRISKLTGYPLEDIRSFGIELRNSDQPSIDAFLFGRPDPKFIEIGKYAIANYIIQSEDKERLPTDPQQNKLDEQKWYGYLLNTYLPTLHDIKLSNLSIITFNYDRSLEYYLYFTLQSRYGLPEKEVVNWVHSIPIVHVYGQVGNPLFDGLAGRDYSSEIDNENLKKGAAGIKLIYDDRNKNENNENLQKIYEIITETDLLIFTGFSYNEDNLKILKLDRYYSRLKIIGTFVGLEQGERDRATASILKYSVLNQWDQVISYDLTTLDLLRKHNYLA